MQKYSLTVLITVFSLMFFCFFYSAGKKTDDKNSSGKDTCFYYLSGTGITTGMTVLDIFPFDCKIKFDSIALVLNQNLKIKFPDAYFQLENRKINGPFKNRKEAEESILDLIKRYNVQK